MVNCCLAQTFCYLLGPVQKTSEHDIWVDTIVIPEQTCSVDSVEDVGLEGQDSITYLRETSLTNNRENMPGFTHAPGENRCEFISNDMHTLFVFEKYVSKNITYWDHH